MKKIKTYEGFWDFFKKKERLPKDILTGGEISNRVKNFFNTSSFSDFNYIVKEITDEYGNYEIEYSFNCEFGEFKLSEVNDKFHLEGLNWLQKDQDYVLDRVGNYAQIIINMRMFNDDDEQLISTQLHNINNNKPSKAEFISDVAERILDMCPDVKSYKAGSLNGGSIIYRDNVIKFNF